MTRVNKMKLEICSNESATSSTISDSDFASGYNTSSNTEYKIRSNRKSYYDNHLKDDTSDTNSSESENNLNSDSSVKIEKDDFEDLIDLTHRVPRRLMTKSSPSSLRKKGGKPSSLPPLPPLPYSFVNIERSKGDSNLYLNKKEDCNERTTCRKSITRLIMPVTNISKNTNKKESEKIKSNDVVQEWDQINRIFASLETLLNDVVQTNSKSVSFGSRSNMDIQNFQKDKSRHSFRAMSENNLKKTDNQINSLSFNSINRSNSKSKYVKKLLGNSPINESVEFNSFHLNMKKFKYFELSEYLSKLNMSKYEFKFLTNGYDDLAFLNNVLTLQDLIQIGIEDYTDIFNLLNEIKKLPSKIKRIANDKLQFSSVSEWLNYLNLNEYKENFTKNNVIGMEMVKSLWEIELSTIIQVPLLGHRKRMINSIKLMLQNDESIIKTSRIEYPDQEDIDIDCIDEDHLFKSQKNSMKQIYSSFKADDLIYSSSSSSSKSSDTSSPHLSCSSRHCASSECESKKRQSSKVDKNYSNSLMELNSNPSVIKQNRGETQKRRSSSVKKNIQIKPSEKSCPKTIWKNDPQNLIKGSFNFVVNYLGSSAITKTKLNEDPVKTTIDRLKNTSKNTPYALPKIELAVSINGVKLLNVKTKEILFNYDIKHINNVCQDQDDLNYFAFSTQTDPNSHYYCHVFSCKDKDLSTQIILTIGQAFDVAFELFCKNNFN